MKGYLTEQAAQEAYDSLDLNRAISSYRFFYPTVSGSAIFNGTTKAGVEPNRKFGYMDTQPRHVGYTLNSDTPYGAVFLDLHVGPMVVDLPPGPLLGAALDFSQRWIADMGIPGPDAGKGGKHLLLPPGYNGQVPGGYHIGRATSFRVIAGMRSIPEKGDLAAAIERLKSIRVYPLEKPADWADPTWFDMTPQPQDTTPHSFEESLGYWRVLHQAVNDEPPLEDLRAQYGELAALGIAKGEPFDPDERIPARPQIGHLQSESLATLGRNGRSRSNGISGQLAPEYPLDRATPLESSFTLQIAHRDRHHCAGGDAECLFVHIEERRVVGWRQVHVRVRRCDADEEKESRNLPRVERKIL